MPIVSPVGQPTMMAKIPHAAGWEDLISICAAHGGRTEDFMNIWDLLIGGAVAIAVLLALRSIFRQRKKGGCCGDCARCSACSHADKH